jgi:hypothetical protein
MPATSFSSYLGAILHPSSSATVTIMEVNKGPDLSYKDRDGQIKEDMTSDMPNLVCLKK